MPSNCYLKSASFFLFSCSNFGNRPVIYVQCLHSEVQLTHAFQKREKLLTKHAYVIYALIFTTMRTLYLRLVIVHKCYKIGRFILPRLNSILCINVSFSTRARTRSAFRQYGNVMGTMIVATTRMKPRTARTGGVQQITSSMYCIMVLRK